MLEVPLLSVHGLNHEVTEGLPRLLRSLALVAGRKPWNWALLPGIWRCGRDLWVDAEVVRVRIEGDFYVELWTRIPDRRRRVMRSGAPARRSTTVKP